MSFSLASNLCVQCLEMLISTKPLVGFARDWCQLHLGSVRRLQTTA